MNLGAHMSIAGGVYKALERGKYIGCNVVQIFTKNQTRWSSPPLKAEDIELFIKLKPHFFSVFAHASYLINLASPDRAVYRKSVNNLAEELMRCHSLRITMLVLHPGSHMGDGESKGIMRVVQGIQASYAQSRAYEVEILLETTSGQGTSLGSRFEHLRDIMGELVSRKYNIDICLDTCHIFSAGYDIRDPESYTRTWQEFDARLGMPRLKAIHLNDSKRGPGSRIDRHEHIGQGEIGLQGFKLILNDPALSSIPMSLETPKGPDLKDDIENLSLLRSLRS